MKADLETEPFGVMRSLSMLAIRSCDSEHPKVLRVFVLVIIIAKDIYDND